MDEMTENFIIHDDSGSENDLKFLFIIIIQNKKSIIVNTWTEIMKNVFNLNLLFLVVNIKLKKKNIIYERSNCEKYIRIVHY